MTDDELRVLVDDLADPDPVVRDEGALGGLSEALLGDDPVSDRAAAQVHDYALREPGPLSGCGEPEGGDGVFGRSFTIELLALLHHRDNARPFLSDAAWDRSLAVLEQHAEHEQDFRSHTGDRGWAHVVAHTADLTGELLTGPRGTAGRAVRALDALVTLVGRAPRVFAGEEEDRVAMALVEAVTGGALTLPGLTPLVDRSVAADADGVRRLNWKAVVRSLAFRLDDLTAPTWDELRRLEARLTRL